MSMDSAMDSLSTTSDHSIASSNESVHNMRSRSPHRNDSGHHSSRPNSHDKTRTPTPGSPMPFSHRDLRTLRDGPHSPLTSGGPQMLPMPHPLSPPQVSTPSNLMGIQTRMAQSLSHLPPHGLGLLNSFMHHASPLDLMAVAHHHAPPRSYNSPPPISSSDPTANECKLVDYRGQKVAAFIIQGETMLCLPQAFELFLKHLVGGLHTVYTKLKRLDIVPLVCNVEQVRILRGLGAIQPGVNRCKLLACKDFDILYRDCTTARCLSIKPPERPPKRGPVGLSLPATSHLNPNHPQLKKHRLDNGDYPYENGHLSDMSRLDKSPLLANGYNAPPTHLNPMAPFMAQMGHHGGPLMSPGMPPHGLQRPGEGMMKNQNMPSMEAITRSGIWENCRAAYEDIVKHLERLRDERGEERGNDMDVKMRGGQSSPRASSNGGHSPVLNLSKSGNEHGSAPPSERSDVHSPNPSIREDDDNMSDGNVSEIDEHNEKDDDELSDTEHPVTTTPPPASSAELDSRQHALNYSALAAAASVPNGQDPNLSSTETLLRNIQGLLKVAADNARQQERQINFEKAELKMDVLREREVKDSLERQLTEEQKLRVLYQKRYKRERRMRGKLQHQMENELKKRNQIEDILKASGAPAEALRILAENNNTTINNNNNSTSMESESGSNKDKNRDSEKDRNRSDKEREKSLSDHNKANSSGSPMRPRSRDLPAEREKNWNYPPGLDNIMATGAFWQNYSESLAQEMELERKNRQASENDVKGSLQERSNYYKNSTLYAT
ncbi:dachshund homolog 2 isoform X2 [Chironomus tepperi]|uniref:dachshund homolog 2 isoform X2 n=1 Tax=Chironomus tepperi TaxID=113505 RepID=UPI00391F0DDE